MYDAFRIANVFSNSSTWSENYSRRPIENNNNHTNHTSSLSLLLACLPLGLVPMPNYSSSSIDWAMSVEGCHLLKKRNLLENLQVLSSISSYPPAPPPFQDFITHHISKKRLRASVSTGSDNTNSFYLPHQIPSPLLLDRTNYNYAKIRAKPLYDFKYNQASIWTMTPPITTDSSLPFDINVVNQFFAMQSKQTSENQRWINGEQRPKNSSKPFQLLDKSSQIIYDVPMRHLLQLLTKSEEKNANIDSIIRGIETGDLNTEWLQCVQRLNHSLNKQFRQRPEDKIKLENYTGDHLDQLNPVEQFFIKLIRIPNYNFKLKCYQFRDESRAQLILLNQCIDRLTQGIDLVLNHQYLPGILHLLCRLYNTVSNQCVPGLDLPSLLDALSSPTVKSNVTVAHVLARILDDHYPDYLTNVIHDTRLLELKRLTSVKHATIFGEIREIYQQFQQLEYEFLNLNCHHHELPSFIEPMFIEMKIEFEKFFAHEELVKKGEQNLIAYLCANDLSLEVCLSIVGQLVDKLRLAHIDNGKECKRQLTQIKTSTARSRSLSLQISSTSFLSCMQMTTRCLLQYS